jgi:hypothetical protein
MRSDATRRALLLLLLLLALADAQDALSNSTAALAAGDVSSAATSVWTLRDDKCLVRARGWGADLQLPDWLTHAVTAAAPQRRCVTAASAPLSWCASQVTYNRRVHSNSTPVGHQSVRPCRCTATGV